MGFQDLGWFPKTWVGSQEPGLVPRTWVGPQESRMATRKGCAKDGPKTWDGAQMKEVSWMVPKGLAWSP